MTGAGNRERLSSPRFCSVPECGRPHLARGLCRPHYLRWRREGDPHPERPVLHRHTRSDHRYRAAQRRVRSVRGRAATQPCADCTADAAVWSYDGTDRDPRTDGPGGRRYSLDPSRYRPRCRSCHRRAGDRDGRSAPLNAERAARLYEAGASSTGIAAVLGVGPSTVLRALRAHGVVIRPRRRGAGVDQNAAQRALDRPISKGRAR